MFDIILKVFKQHKKYVCLFFAKRQYCTKNGLECHILPLLSFILSIYSPG